jgi:putative membrane protein
MRHAAAKLLTALSLTAPLGLAACVPATMSPSAAVATSAPQFATLATVSNTFEIETSRLALQASSNPRVRRFAQQMISDHTLATRRMMAVAQSQGLPPMPPTLDAAHQAMLARLQGLNGPAFDAEYVSQQSLAHAEAITLFSTYAERGDNPAFVRFARQTLPVLQMHAQHVAALRSGGPGV